MFRHEGQESWIFAGPQFLTRCNLYYIYDMSEQTNYTWRNHVCLHLEACNLRYDTPWLRDNLANFLRQAHDRINDYVAR